MKPLALIACLYLAGCTVAVLPHEDIYLAILGSGSVERGCSQAPQCGPTEAMEVECVRIEGKGFSAGFAGVLEAAVTAASAYFGLGM